MAKQIPKDVQTVIKSIEIELEKLIKEAGLSRTDPADKAARSALRKKITRLIPENYNLQGINSYFRGGKLDLQPSKAGSQEISKRFIDEIKPGDERRAKQVDKNPKAVKRQKLRTDITKQFRDSILKLNINEANLSKKQKNALIDKYIDEINHKNRALSNERTRLNRILPEGSKQSIGHLQPVSKAIDSSSNRVLEPLTINIQKGDNYSLTPAGQMAIGNPSKTDVSKIDNWKNDFLVWADKPENGGSGVFPQRGGYSELMEQKLSEMSGIQYDKLDNASKAKAVQDIDDFQRTLQNRNPFTIGQQADQKKWGILSQDQSDQMGKFAEETNFKPKPQYETGELGSRLGGIGNKMKIGGKLRTADSLAQIASGNYIGGGLSLALQQDPVQKQIAKLLAKRASKTTAKLVPGVDIGLSAVEAAQYFSSGNYIQGGIAMLSGAVGWIPGMGDAASASLDLVNTGIDINKLKTKGIMNRHKKIDTDNLDLNLRGFKGF